MLFGGVIRFNRFGDDGACGVASLPILAFGGDRSCDVATLENTEYRVQKTD